MKSLLTEIRDWLETAATGIGLYLTWRWRPRKERRDVTIHAPAATARAVMPTPTLYLSPAHGTSSARMALTTGNDTGTQAVLDSMAEVFPYEFPSN